MTSYLDRFDHVVTLDVETYFDNDYSLRKMTMTEYICDPRFKLHSIAIKHLNKPTEYFDTDHIELAVQHLKLLKNWALVGQNTAFDAAVLNWHYGVKPDFYFDTMSMSRGFWPTESGSLKALAERLFPDNKQMRKGTELVNFIGVKTLTPEQHVVMKRYNVQDVDLTEAIFLKLLSYGFPEEELYQIHMVMRMYVEPSFVIDRPLLEAAIEDDERETSEAVNKALAQVKDELITRQVQRFDLPLDKKLFSSNQRFARLLEEVLDIKPPIKLNAKGAPTYAFGKRDVDFIKMRNDYPDFEPVFMARELVKSTIAASRAATMLCCSQPSTINPEGRLPVPLRYYGAATGRMSGTDGINLQNLQRGSRHRLALTAPKNHLVYVADSSNIECLHGDGVVLTDSGLKKLRDVMLTDKLWDGVEWVSHQGVINKGVRNVITYRGITATPDHVVYLTTGEAVQLAEAKARGASLMVGEIGGQAVHWLDSTKQTSATGQKTECLRSLRLRIREIVSSFGLDKRQIEKVQKLREFGTDSEILQCEVWDIVNAGPRHRFVYNGFIVSNCRVNSRFAGQTDLLDGFRHGLDVYSQFASEVVFGYPVDKSMKTERQVGKVCILGLGYGMGWRTFQRTLRSGPMGAPPMECSDEFAQKCVFGYREKYPMIANSWQIASAMIAQMLDPQCDIEWGPLRVLHNCIALPNGLWLSYPGLRQRADDGPNGPETWFEYWNGKFWKKTYGGLQIENISQCLAGLIIKEQMNKVDRWLQENGLGQIVLQVHDEIIVVAKENHPTITPDDIQAKMIEIMSTPPSWFSDIPLNAEGGYAKEYSK